MEHNHEHKHIKLNRHQRRKAEKLMRSKKGKQMIRAQERLQKMWEKVIPNSTEEARETSDFRAPEIDSNPATNEILENKETV